MKVIPSLALLLASAMSAMASQGVRGLQSFDVAITEVSGQTIKFNTGTGMGPGTSVKVKVTNLCRTESANRITEGFLYPDNNVPGIVADTSGVVDPGPGSVLSIRFVEGIASNTDIYKSNGGMPPTASVSFCVEIGLYVGEEDMQVNFKEVKVTYNLDLMSNIPSLKAHTP